MTKIILSGCGGKLGKVIVAAVAARQDCEIVAGVDVRGSTGEGFPVFPSLQMCTVAADVIIDFSHPSCTEDILAYSLAQHTPAVIATTGLSQEQIQKITDSSASTALFFTFNMSLGINLLVELTKKAVAVLGEDFDVEIVEKHHNQKIDAPSGTAIMLADAAAETMASSPAYVYERQSKREKRSKNEIGIHSLRGGTICGEHEVIFAGKDEIVTLTHTALSKGIFATGAINAALFIQDKKSGLFSMKDLM